jgi:hypothetical protein
MFRCEPAAGQKLIEILSGRSDFISNLIKQGQAKGEINNAFTGEDLTMIILGMLKEFTLIWRMGNGNFPLKERVMNSLKVLLEHC